MTMMNEMILPSIEEIIEINKKFNGGMKRVDLEFIKGSGDIHNEIFH